MPITLLNTNGTGGISFINSTNTGRISFTSVIPSIVTSSLWLNLDAGNPASYPGTGNTWTDLSDTGHNFTKSAGTYVASPIKCFSGGSFTATNFFGDDLTVQAWINTTSVGNNNNHYGYMQIISAETLGNSNDFGFGVNQSAKLGFGAGPSDATVATVASVNTGTWTNVAVTRTKSTGGVRLYINGILNRTGSSNSGNTLNAATNVTIGGGADQSKTWIGLMNNILSYSTVLSDASILQNYYAQYSTYYSVI